MDLQRIAVLTRLSVRKVRYVLDHRLLPGLRIAGQPDLIGRARILTDLEGFSVACVAILLEAGVRKKSVVDLMTGLSQFPLDIPRKLRHPTYAIQRAFEPRVTPAEASLGDGVNLRFKLGDKDTGWMQPGTYAPLADGYQPGVVISIDLAPLRDVFLAHR